MADTLVTLALAIEQPPANVAERLLVAGEQPHSLEALARIMREVSGTVPRAVKATVRVDGVTRAAAAGVVAVDSSETEVDDTLRVSIPGLPVVDLVAVALTASAPAGSGRWSLETVTNTAQGASLAAAINTHPLLKRHLVAVNATGTVTITAREPGTWAHGIVLAKIVDDAGALTITQFAGGADAMAQPRAVATFGAPNIANDNTITIGSVVFTWKAAPANENEIETSSDETVAAPRFVAAVNAHSKLKGLVHATLTSAAVVTVTWLGDPRAGIMIPVARTETNSGSVTWGGAALAVGTALAHQADPRSYGRGLA